jgi:cytoskeletal protein CcmA (bactofilin family)
LGPEEVLSQRFGKTRSALGEGTVIQGKLSFDTPVRIDGKLSGEILSSRALIVGPSGRVDATIEAATLIILGHVSGKVSATERVELWAGAKVEGAIRTPVLVIQEGSFFVGSTEMLSAQIGQMEFGKGTTNKAPGSINKSGGGASTEATGQVAKSSAQVGGSEAKSGSPSTASSVKPVDSQLATKH